MIGSPENNFQTMQQNPPSQPKNMMLANALQNYGGNNMSQAMQGFGQIFKNAAQGQYGKFQPSQSNGIPNQSMGSGNGYMGGFGMGNTNYATPGGQGTQPYGFNAYAQGMNKSTNMQPQLPQPTQPQAIKY